MLTCSFQRSCRKSARRRVSPIISMRLNSCPACIACCIYSEAVCSLHERVSQTLNMNTIRRTIPQGIFQTVRVSSHAPLPSHIRSKANAPAGTPNNSGEPVNEAYRHSLLPAIMPHWPSHVLQTPHGITDLYAALRWPNKMSDVFTW